MVILYRKIEFAQNCLFQATIISQTVAYIISWMQDFNCIQFLPQHNSCIQFLIYCTTIFACHRKNTIKLQPYCVAVLIEYKYSTQLQGASKFHIYLGFLFYTVRKDCPGPTHQLSPPFLTARFPMYVNGKLWFNTVYTVYDQRKVGLALCCTLCHSSEKKFQDTEILSAYRKNRTALQLLGTMQL